MRCVALSCFKLPSGSANAASHPRVFEPPDLDPPQCVGRFALSAGQKGSISVLCFVFPILFKCTPVVFESSTVFRAVLFFRQNSSIAHPSPGAGIDIHRGTDGPSTFHALVKYRHVLGISGSRTFKQQQHFQLGEKWDASDDVFHQRKKPQHCSFSTQRRQVGSSLRFKRARKGSVIAVGSCK